MTDYTPEELQQLRLRHETRQRVQQALHQIEAAQTALGNACSTLSGLVGAIPQHRATSKLYDNVHAHWYKVRDALEGNPKITLDSLNAAAVLRAQEGKHEGI